MGPLSYDYVGGLVLCLFNDAFAHGLYHLSPACVTSLERCISHVQFMKGRAKGGHSSISIQIVILYWTQLSLAKKEYQHKRSTILNLRVLYFPNRKMQLYTNQMVFRWYSQRLLSSVILFMLQWSMGPLNQMYTPIHLHPLLSLSQTGATPGQINLPSN